MVSGQKLALARVLSNAMNGSLRRIDQPTIRRVFNHPQGMFKRQKAVR